MWDSSLGDRNQSDQSKGHTARNEQLQLNSHKYVSRPRRILTAQTLIEWNYSAHLKVNPLITLHYKYYTSKFEQNVSQ